MLAVKLIPVTALVAATLGLASCNQGASNATPGSVGQKTADGYSYRDLNKNGKLDVYEDTRQPVEARVDDLLKQMTLDEKAGLLFINGAKVNDDGSIEDKPATGMFAFVPNALKLVKQQHMNHFNLWIVPSPASLAKWYNTMQRYLQDSTRLGIPMTIASDPRNHFSSNIFAMSANTFSQWCEPLGLGAIGDSTLTMQFADISRREYMAVGIREALHPQVDLATEPRWPRISGTFGEDAQLTARMARAYILGYQGAKLDSNSVACMTKHFSGGGPQKEGLDPHFPFQKGQVYPGKNFKYHLIPFEAAFDVHTAAIMPYYGVPMGQTSEDVGFSFNKDIITGLLRNTYHYDGVVCTDWGLLTDANMGGVVWPARAWGVEKLSTEDRVKKIIDAGVDQFGGENCPEIVVQLVKGGRLTEARIDSSARRLLRQKFELGLFDNPFVDESKVGQIVGNPESLKAGEASQRRAMTLLKNDGKALPLAPGKLKIYVRNVDPKIAAQYGTVVDQPEKADIAILRLKTPFYPVESPIMMARMFHHGDLDFKGKQKDSILQLLKTVPTIVDIYLDRPAVIPEISAKAKGLLADFGASDAAVLDVIFGKDKPGGHLPIELPSSMNAVRAQKEDVPYDSRNPLYKFGYGLSY
ncbi:glycoside hydrolase family 3 protein [Puia dinghuensis]|uniref:beta-glucosidase n=1 Tax=Puia dinghuensis TaxID=1792502 RepID=A0A8J2XPQ3_9BACT|nr:glycoside hydrolase family 3 N-terminal domain-containing protein [Puia dinghuensis]GGA81527.1 beta-glucosidase [Puia dinghuensis]